jgi:tetratricopeptide (TPR) repeat protein
VLRYKLLLAISWQLVLSGISPYSDRDTGSGAATENDLPLLGSCQSGVQTSQSSGIQALVEALDRAGLSMAQGRFEEARRGYERILVMVEKTSGRESLHAATILAQLCLATYQAHPQLDAKMFCLRALAIRQNVLAPNHPDVARSLNDLGGAYEFEGDLRNAITLYQKAAAIMASAPPSPDSGVPLANVASMYHRMKKYKLAEGAFLRAIAMLEANGADPYQLATALANLGYVYLAEKKFEPAEGVLHKALTILETFEGPILIENEQLLGLAKALATKKEGPEASALIGRVDALIGRSAARDGKRVGGRSRIPVETLQ